MNSIFGVELPTPVSFVLAFVVVLALIALAAWAVRRFGGGRLEAADRKRQPRLAVIDSSVVDGRRKLVIIRRDNVEHLLMIGGPTDVVVETNIIRSSSTATRDSQARGAANDVLPRTMPLPDTTPWPEPALAPIPAAAPAPTTRAERPRPAEPTVEWPTVPPEAPAAPAIPPVRSQQRHADALAGLAADLAVKPAPAAPPVKPEPRVAAPATQPASGESDKNLAEMAQRLEAALRRPSAQNPAAGQRPEVSAEPRRVEPRLSAILPEQTRAAPAPAPAQPAAPKAPAPNTDFENLEQEMASLLGRPSSGKT